MPSRYQLVLHGEIIELLFQLRRAERRKLMDFFDTLVSRPNLAGDYEECDSVGRSNQVMILGRWAVTYWTDHAVSEVRVVRIEPA